MKTSFKLAIWAGLCYLGVNLPVSFGEEFLYDSHGKRDPFLPANVKRMAETAPIQTTLFLEGIVYDPAGGSVAMVNGQMLKEGDVFNGMTLVRVEENKAVFDREGELIEVALSKDDELMDEYLIGNTVNKDETTADNRTDMTKESIS